MTADLEGDRATARAENAKAVAYLQGQGVAKNLAQAAIHFQKAAELGYEKAQFNLGLMYAKGIGVPKNLETARFWFSKAAQAGEAKALDALKAFGLSANSQSAERATPKPTPDVSAVNSGATEPANQVAPNAQEVRQHLGVLANAGKSTAVAVAGLAQRYAARLYERVRSAKANSETEASPSVQVKGTLGGAVAKIKHGAVGARGLGRRVSRRKRFALGIATVIAVGVAAAASVGIPSGLPKKLLSVVTLLVAPGTTCDELAGSPYDPNRKAAGVLFRKMRQEAQPAIATAITACRRAVEKSPNEPRFSFQLGRAYQAQKNYGEAAKAYQQAADQNYLIAQTNRAQLFRFARGAPKNEKRALQLLEDAVTKGDLFAHYALSNFLVAGVEGKKDERRAFALAEKAAEGGIDLSQYLLGEMYRKGIGTRKDPRLALKWYEQAAKQGHGQAAHTAYIMLWHGKGVEEDKQKALAWLRTSVDLGFPLALRNLGWHYEYGYEMPQDFEKARVWYEKAKKAGYKDAQKELINLAKRVEGAAKAQEQSERLGQALSKVGGSTHFRAGGIGEIDGYIKGTIKTNVENIEVTLTEYNVGFEGEREVLTKYRHRDGSSGGRLRTSNCATSDSIFVELACDGKKTNWDGVQMKSGYSSFDETYCAGKIFRNGPTITFPLEKKSIQRPSSCVLIIHLQNNTIDWQDYQFGTHMHW